MQNNEIKLKFSTHNGKMVELQKFTGKKVVCFDLPVGHTCPFADKCFCTVNRDTGKLTDGENQVYRCFASSAECAFTNTRKLRWHNFDLLKDKSQTAMTELINASIPNKTEIVRIHSAGDFFNRAYFNAWVEIAKLNPKIKFFGYTKGIQYVRQAKPENFKLVYSYGGKLDTKVVQTDPVAYVVNSKIEAENMGLILPCELNSAGDYFAINAQLSFALLLHGTQPAKSK